MTQREHDVLMTILHHVACYNGRSIAAVTCRPVTTLVSGQPVPADLVIERVEFEPTPRKSA